MKTETKPDFRVVEYKNGMPQGKVEFHYPSDAEAYRDRMIAERTEQRARGYWQDTAWHYIAEMNY